MKIETLVSADFLVGGTLQPYPRFSGVEDVGLPGVCAASPADRVNWGQP